jgi:hypothetical protein
MPAVAAAMTARARTGPAAPPALARTANQANSGIAMRARTATSSSKPTPRWYSALPKSPLLANRIAEPATNNMPSLSVLEAVWLSGVADTVRLLIGVVAYTGRPQMRMASSGMGAGSVECRAS